MALSGSVTLAFDGQLVSGLVVSPHAELGLFLFVPDEPDLLESHVEEGALVRIRTQGSKVFDAVAEVLEVDGRERWVLSVPVQLEPQQQRRSERVLSDGAWTLRTHLGETLDIYDLSDDGIGIEFPAGGGPAGVGEGIVGILRAANMGSFEVRVECTNVRPHPDDARLWIVGGRMSVADEAARRAFEATLKGFVR
jgi:hypothetical protein